MSDTEKTEWAKFQASVKPELKDKLDGLIDRIGADTKAEALEILANIAEKQLIEECEESETNKNYRTVESKFNQALQTVREVISLAEKDKSIAIDTLVSKTEQYKAELDELKESHASDIRSMIERQDDLQTDNEVVHQRNNELQQYKDAQESLKEMFATAQTAWKNERKGLETKVADSKEILDQEVKLHKKALDDIKALKSELSMTKSTIRKLEEEIILNNHNHEIKLKEAELQAEKRQIKVTNECQIKFDKEKAILERKIEEVRKSEQKQAAERLAQIEVQLTNSQKIILSLSSPKKQVAAKPKPRAKTQTKTKAKS